MMLDQLEAMRLADLEGMSHNDAADYMKVSRQTFGRIIEQARQIVTLALINGKTLKIGCTENIQFIEMEIKCIECGKEWMMQGDRPDDLITCTECGSSEIIKRARCGKHCECPLRINKVPLGG
jgi:DNA-directed RNA polymerase subunit RPC12/RpoP